MANNRTVQEDNLIAHAEALSKQRALRDAFLALFGAPGKRTPMGATVIDHLERFTSYRRPIETLDSTGQTDVHRYFTAIGRQQVMQAIHNAIEWRESDHVNPSSPST
jgi:hypothetical protein